MKLFERLTVKPTLAKSLREKGHQFRHALSYIDALPQLTFLGLIIGVLTGGIIILFRLLIELPFLWPIPTEPENFEALAPTQRVMLVLVGCTLIYFLLRLAGPSRRELSVSHVLERLHNYQGRLPFINWAVQFIGGVLCIVTGQSVGREGPAIHLGAGAASQIGQFLKLPNNSLHTLVGCGVAAAIAASFDTPMAGVIFAMEVIVMEYTVIGFVPVILAATIGTVMSRAVFHDVGPIIVSTTEMHSLLELPLLTVTGLILSLCAAMFIRIHIEAIKFQGKPLALRIAIAGLIGSCAALLIPEVMGLSYDTLSDAMFGKLAFGALVIIAIAKLCITAAVVGLGIPGGIIGPMLVSGACLGSAIGIVADSFSVSTNFDPGFYAIIGMAGMMAAIINAPLAALVAVLELSYNPNMIFPSMLVIVVACTCTRTLFGYKGIFLEQLKYSGRELELKPAQQILRRSGVRSVMEHRVVSSPRYVGYEETKKLLSGKPIWVVIGEGSDKVALNAAHLASWLAERAPVEVLSLQEEIDLLSIPGDRINMLPIHEGANLWEALEAMRSEKTTALYISRVSSPLESEVQGVLTEQQIDNYYLS